ncbi:Fur family transcriptional regulator [Brumimicrobium oceani]|uniref:Transcriptional repressor n=1 Tax=Brumimicrobium oceani TaxID=2100725 RepID=A0A2U2XB57_9FLAO|nr:transcriptional repressor [Brumimicrobium oceani]PWH85026.1 transcriptional repressor [Brumimicrobium oceani]
MNSNTKIESELNKREIRPTAMRMIVLRYFLEEKNCTSLTELEEKFDHADKSTLFRTLTTFEQKGLIHRIEDGTGFTKFGLCTEDCDCSFDFQHYHFHCINCNETFCLKSLKPQSLNLPKGFMVQSANLVLKGHCSNCN